MMFRQWMRLLCLQPHFQRYICGADASIAYTNNFWNYPKIRFVCLLFYRLLIFDIFCANCAYSHVFKRVVYEARTSVSCQKCKYFWIYPKITFAFLLGYSEKSFRCINAIDMILQQIYKNQHPILVFNSCIFKCGNFWVAYWPCSTFSGTRRDVLALNS